MHTVHPADRGTASSPDPQGSRSWDAHQEQTPCAMQCPDSRRRLISSRKSAAGTHRKGIRRAKKQPGLAGGTSRAAQEQVGMAGTAVTASAALQGALAALPWGSKRPF